ncbi:twin-arginine translocase TatA/TatE family subunit [Mucilaginibacter sp. UR6-11]|uniref:twin-arginine translocase TatA/TatE family subunit n=1 Tax=Mucilaginibacter sp. UR6-11 TaxID=1435644 RepID=UPI001E4B5915|nr:twin-arginine translocase TatA/TatE family subunit [Mucilaginibacter sp. UR6-11]MCC8425223.1 twin-arginine translocase TatA/TatE family subunit [Mucilaginibacter sp. UR6-11]
MGLDGPAVFVILLVVLLIFGGKKIPELMKGLGKGVKEFKDAQSGDSDDHVRSEDKTKV